jgi:hypothetical protein
MDRKRKKQKADPKHWLFTPRWFNPVLYLYVILAFFISMYDGGIKEWWKESIDLFKNFVH